MNLELNEEQLQMFRENSSFASYFAHKFHRGNPSVEFDDLHQVALIELVASISKHGKFSAAFARKFIVFGLRKFVDNNCGLIRVPKTNLLRMRKSFKSEEFRKSLSPLEKRNLYLCRIDVFSFNVPVMSDEEEFTYEDILPSKPIEDGRYFGEDFRFEESDLRSLSEKEQLIVRRLYLSEEPEKRENIAKGIGMCVSSVRYMESNALKKLKAVVALKLFNAAFRAGLKDAHQAASPH